MFVEKLADSYGVKKMAQKKNIAGQGPKQRLWLSRFKRVFILKNVTLEGRQTYQAHSHPEHYTELIDTIQHLFAQGKKIYSIHQNMYQKCTGRCPKTYR